MGLREGSEVWLKFGQAENLALNVPHCHMTLVPALGGEAVVDWQDMNSGLYWYKDIEITRLISPTGPQQCYLCHHSPQLGWECSEVPSVNAVLYPTGLVLLQFLRLGCCHCSLTARGFRVLAALLYQYEATLWVPRRSQECPVQLSTWVGLICSMTCVVPATWWVIQQPWSYVANPLGVISFLWLGDLGFA